MIAPIRPQQTTSPGIAEARRAVGALLLRNRAQATESGRDVSRRGAWLLLGWAAVVAVLFLMRGRD